MRIRLSGRTVPRKRGYSGKPGRSYPTRVVSVVVRRHVSPPSFRAMTIMECWL